MPEVVMTTVTRRRRMMTFIGVVLGANLQVLDTTMVAVALPRVQGSLSATQDEITWVLAAYLIAVAIVMPTVGVLTERIGRRNLFLISISGFCVASMFTGFSESLTEVVAFRFIQGIFAASLVPISQSFVFDAFTPSERGRAMAWWSMGMMAGIVLGPALGGYLAEFHSWRWAFYLNLPIGIIAFGIIYAVVPRSRIKIEVRPFGLVGFFLLVIALVALQLVLSRGEKVDWFSSSQIIIAISVSLVAFYFFILHSTYSSRPFIDPSIFADRNFVVGLILQFMLGIHWLSFLALISPYLQTLAGFPVFLAGLVMLPQAAGNATGSLIAGEVLNKISPVPIVIMGILLLAWANWQMSTFTHEFARWPFLIAVFAHGIGIGAYFVPVTVITFSTLPRKYTDTGTGLYALMRNFGSSVGVSLTVALLIRQSQLNRTVISEDISHFNDALNHLLMPELWDLREAAGLIFLEGEATRQATTLAYNADFICLAVASFVCIVPLLCARLPEKVKKPNQ